MSDKEIGNPAEVEKSIEKNSDLHVHERKKTVAEGLLDIGLLVANASQLKGLLDQGDSYVYYYVVLVFLILSILVQITVGMLILFMGTLEGDEANELRANRTDDAVMGLVFISIIINVIISVFGISTQTKIIVRNSVTNTTV